MALYSLSGYPEFVADDFMVIDAGNEEYHLCGVTLGPQRAVPNPILWNRCYALGPNAYVIVSPPSILLLVNGQEVAKTSRGPEVATMFRDPLFISRVSRKNIGIDDKHKHQSQSLWLPIKEYLKTISETDEGAAKILHAMEEWETTSMQTLQWLKNKKGGWSILYDKTEVLILGTRWLVHYRRGSKWIVGESENVWGEVHLPLEQAGIYMAAPIQDGWIIKTREKDWLLRRKNNGTIELQEITCPVGPWKKLGAWIYWESDRCALSPAGRWIIVPENVAMHGAGSRWLIASILLGELIMIDEMGTTYREAILEAEETLLNMLAGDSSIFVVSGAARGTCFYMIPNSSLPFPRYSWRMVAFSPGKGFVAGLAVIRGDPDAFVILIGLRSSPHIRILCLLNTRGEAWCFPYPFAAESFAAIAHFEERDKGKIVIGVKSAKEKVMEIGLGVCDNAVQLDLGDGVLFAGKMTSLPVDQEDALWQFLEPFLIQGGAK